jgi:hypothetical protein
MVKIRDQIQIITEYLVQTITHNLTAQAGNRKLRLLDMKKKEEKHEQKEQKPHKIWPL